MAEKYAHTEVLVETDWVAAHANDAGIRLVEVDVDTSAYSQGHIAEVKDGLYQIKFLLGAGQTLYQCREASYRQSFCGVHLGDGHQDERQIH